MIYKLQSCGPPVEASDLGLIVLDNLTMSLFRTEANRFENPVQYSHTKKHTISSARPKKAKEGTTLSLLYAYGRSFSEVGQPVVVALVFFLPRSDVPLFVILLRSFEKGPYRTF